jgi:hypothetical protein
VLVLSSLVALVVLVLFSLVALVVMVFSSLVVAKKKCIARRDIKLDMFMWEPVVVDCRLCDITLGLVLANLYGGLRVVFREIACPGLHSPSQNPAAAEYIIY